MTGPPIRGKGRWITGPAFRVPVPPRNARTLFTGWRTTRNNRDPVLMGLRPV